MASANPAMNPAVYDRAGYVDSPSQVMTLQGTAAKGLLLIGILLAAAIFPWSQAGAGGDRSVASGLTMLGGIGGFIVALITCFYPRYSPFTAPVYAACQGLFLGGISALFEAVYSGIVFQAASLSVGILAVMLFVYATGMIRATEKFKIGVVAATGAIALVYLADLVLSFFSVRVPFIHESGLFGIGFSIFVVVVAAMNLILDFDFIEQGVRAQAPTYMEWYGAFSLLVTLVWMYLEILRLLAKLSNNRS